MKNELFYPRNNNLAFRLNLCYILSLIFPFEIIFNSINNNNKLLTNFFDIENSINNNNKIITKFLYINRYIIHEILYDSDNVIRLYDKHAKCLGDYFYIDLLIKYNFDIIDYYYSLDFIEKLNNYLKKDYNLGIKNIIISKISLDLIYNYKGSDEYDEDKDSEVLNKIEENNNDIILNNINHLKDLNINYNKNEILSMGVDDIYTEIIISLIKSNKFKNFEYIYNILNQLDLKSIYLNDKMFRQLREKLDISEDYINKYKISDIDDLFNIEKINFYYLLIKFILKNTFFIYQIPLLLYTRKKIIKIIKNNLNKLSSLKAKQDNNIINERIDYIIDKMTDSKYYYNKYKNSDKIIIQLKVVLDYYKNYLFESKKEDINIIEEIINNGKNVEYDKYLYDYENAVKLNNRLKIINYLFNNENIKMTEKEMRKHVGDWKALELLIKKKCYKKLTKNIKIQLFKYFFNKENESIILKIFKEDEYKTFIDKNMRFLNNNNDENKLIVKEDIEKKDISEYNSNIKSTSNSAINVNVLESINEISKKNDTSIIIESIYIQSQNINMEQKRINNNKQETEKNQDFNFYNMSFIKEIESDILKLIKKSSRYNILEYSKTLINYKNPKVIKKLTNDYYIIGGDEKYILLYDYLYDLIKKIKIGQYTYCIEEIYSNIKKIKIIVGSLYYIYTVEIDLDSNDTKITKYQNVYFPVENIIFIGEDNYIMFGNKGTYIMNNFINTFNKIDKTKILEKSYKNGISINKNIIVFSSNKIYPNGDDILVFYNLITKSIIKKIEGYSFNSSINSLYLINNLNSNGKILLCACKNYNSIKKNGLLLVYIEFNQDKEKFYPCFYDTGDFEVYCFCQISNVDNNNPINGDISRKENIFINNTDYFLVGGFDKNKNGEIKLFKIINKDNPNKIKIICIQDIIIKPNDNFEGFQGPINCMVQSDIFGNIIIGDINNNVYLMNPPNISFYLESRK